MPPRPSDRPGRLSRLRRPTRWPRWLGAVAVLTVAPKCLLCLAGYFGLATALGLGGPEICGAPDSVGLNAWVAWTLVGGAGAGTILLLRCVGRRV